jgi:hypothetical protein
MPAGTSEKQQLFKYVLFTFIAFMVIDTIIKFYFLYFINFETNSLSIVSFILPYVILAVIAFKFYQYNQSITNERRNFIHSQLRKRGLPVRRKIHVTRIKMKLKNQY